MTLGRVRFPQQVESGVKYIEGLPKAPDWKTKAVREYNREQFRKIREEGMLLDSPPLETLTDQGAPPVFQAGK